MTADRELTTDNRHLYKFKCKASCCSKCSYCTQTFSKEKNKSRVSRLLLQRLQIKVCEKCFLCHSTVLYSICNKCQKCCTKSVCRGQISNLLANLAGSGCHSESGSILKEGYILHFLIWPKLTRYPTVISCYGNPHRNLYLLEALHQLIDKKRCRTGATAKISRFFQPTFLVPEPNKKWRSILYLSKLNLSSRQRNSK